MLLIAFMINFLCIPRNERESKHGHNFLTIKQQMEHFIYEKNNNRHLLISATPNVHPCEIIEASVAVCCHVHIIYIAENEVGVPRHYIGHYKTKQKPKCY